MQLEEAIKMINRRSMILLVFFAKQTRLKMRHPGTWVCFNRLFKTLKSSLIIVSVEASLAGKKMGFLFLVQLAVPGWQTTAQSQPKNQDDEQGAVNRPNLHD